MNTDAKASSKTPKVDKTAKPVKRFSDEVRDTIHDHLDDALDLLEKGGNMVHTSQPVEQESLLVLAFGSWSKMFQAVTAGITAVELSHLNSQIAALEDTKKTTGSNEFIEASLKHLCDARDHMNNALKGDAAAAGTADGEGKA